MASQKLISEEGLKRLVAQSVRRWVATRAKVERPWQLAPEIADAIEQWMTAAIHERRGPGKAHGNLDLEGYLFAEFLEVINEACPEAITRMLKAGAAAYIDDGEEHGT